MSSFVTVRSSGAAERRLPARQSLRRIVGLFAVAAVGLSATRAPADPEAASFAYRRDAGTVLARYQLQIGEVADPDPGPSVTVYGDGRAEVHFPRYMKRAGSYRLWLGRDELERLLASLVRSGLPDLDVEAAAAEKAAKAPALAAAPGGSTTVIELRLERYRRPGGAEDRDVEKKVVWQGLRTDARRFPGLPAIRSLVAAEQALRALMEREDLQRIE